MAGFCVSLMVSITNYILFETGGQDTRYSGQESRNLVAIPLILSNFTSFSILGKDVIRITETLEKMQLR